MASTTECQACGSQSGDDMLLCKDCTAKLGRDLISVSWLVRELDAARTRQVRFDRQHGSRSSVTPLPWNPRASSMVTELGSVIGLWSETVHAGVVTELPVGTWKRALYLAGNMPKLRGHLQAGDAHRELTRVIRKARATVDRPPDQVTYGLCGNTDPDETGHPTRTPCDAYLYAGRHEKKIIKCRKCGASFSVEQRREWMLEYVRSMAGTASEVANYLKLAGVKVSADSIKGLRNRNRITALPGTSGRTSLYRFSDVIDAVGSRYRRKR